MRSARGVAEYLVTSGMPVPASNPRVTFDTVHVDGEVLVVAKPRGRVTLPGRGHDRDTLLNGVFAEYGAALARLGARRDYGLLHRLDRATSGLVAFALTAPAYDSLRDAFSNRRVEKSYLTIVEGAPRGEGTCRLRLRQMRRGDLLVSVPDPAGVDAVTHWRVLGRARGRSLVVCRIETGRLHQIRVHLAALGHPIVGDTVYRQANDPDTRASVARSADRSLLLHAWRLRLPHPSGGFLDVEAPPPTALADAVRELGLDPAKALRA
ncbi:MAG: RluA family pseudouridine synthase [Deltaproteobacteria bacterium]|nr:RluA family pseudouridine synthase [Deltaproteobacteria bacterium]